MILIKLDNSPDFSGVRAWSVLPRTPQVSHHWAVGVHTNAQFAIEQCARAVAGWRARAS